MTASTTAELLRLARQVHAAEMIDGFTGDRPTAGPALHLIRRHSQSGQLVTAPVPVPIDFWARYAPQDVLEAVGRNVRIRPAGGVAGVAFSSEAWTVTADDADLAQVLKLGRERKIWTSAARQSCRLTFAVSLTDRWALLHQLDDGTNAVTVLTDVTAEDDHSHYRTFHASGIPAALTELCRAIQAQADLA